jgi:hypothetical protein
MNNGPVPIDREPEPTPAPPPPHARLSPQRQDPHPFLHALVKHVSKLKAGHDCATACTGPSQTPGAARETISRGPGPMWSAG